MVISGAPCRTSVFGNTSLASSLTVWVVNRWTSYLAGSFGSARC